MSDLERRYRRLLAVYPWQHRRVYEEEMLAVLLAGARPGQRRPAAADVRNLLVAGVATRLRLAGRELTRPAWADAAAVTGLLATLVLLALAARTMAGRLVPGPWVPPGNVPGPDLVDWLRLAGWASVAIAALAGARVLAAGLSWAGLAVWSWWLLTHFPASPVLVVDLFPQVAVAVIGAATLTVPAPRRRAAALLGVRRLAVLVLTPLTAVGVLAANRLAQPEMVPHRDYTSYVLYDLEASTQLAVWLYAAALAVLGLAVLLALATLAPQVRRRILVLAAPVAALMLLIDTGLAGWVASNAHMGHPIPLVPAQWTGILLVPVITFLAGVLLVRRREETLRMVALGRAADRERPAG
ncbi:hypothetical protein [Micromonospora mirobrigensis]|uniref:Uncharacterized protein n=1 Tax=Micromonospora mirobrigensis TaxID=262898 RepID=A0A1C4W7F9_9ACTN|nr:hypothetical protein [Micromonospora mirobrigensis]SCE92114.1 hypothetical protein GA0070564_10257 [Micromonospora mirobrigensis]